MTRKKQNSHPGGAKKKKKKTKVVQCCCCCSYVSHLLPTGRPRLHPDCLYWQTKEWQHRRFWKRCRRPTWTHTCCLASNPLLLQNTSHPPWSSTKNLKKTTPNNFLLLPLSSSPQLPQYSPSFPSQSAPTIRTQNAFSLVVLFRLRLFSVSHTHTHTLSLSL